MTLYETLGVPPDASLAQIRKAYRQRAKTDHPDVKPGDPAAAARFVAVSQAYEVLADEDLRLAYDLSLAPRRPARRAPAREPEADWRPIVRRGAERLARQSAEQVLATLEEIFLAGKKPRP